MDYEKKKMATIERALATGKGLKQACESAGISTATYYNWRRLIKHAAQAPAQAVERVAPPALVVYFQGTHSDLQALARVVAGRS